MSDYDHDDYNDHGHGPECYELMRKQAGLSDKSHLFQGTHGQALLEVDRLQSDNAALLEENERLKVAIRVLKTAAINLVNEEFDKYPFGNLHKLREALKEVE